MKLPIVMKATLPDRVRTLLSKIRDLSGLTAYCSDHVALLVRDHLTDVAGRRHATARRLGAEPTGFLADAAGSVVAAPEPRTVVVRVDSPGVKRAYHDVAIKPKNSAKFLTVPIHALSYGRRASSVERLAAARLFVFADKDKDQALLAVRERATGRLLPLYVLKRTVRQAQDPSLMPSEAEIQERLVSSAATYIRRHIAGLARSAS